MRNPIGGLFPASSLQVFSVDTDSIQLCWGDLPSGPLRASVANSTVNTVHFGGPGSVELTGLEPDTHYEVKVEAAGHNEELKLKAKTLLRPNGALHGKFATVSDIHIGARRFGALKTMTDSEKGEEPFALRCARSAIEDAVAWGAEYLIIKGDAMHAQSTKNLASLGELVDSFPDLPMMLIPGNHDVDGRGDLSSLPPVGERKLPYVRGVVTHRLPGIKVVAADTTIAGKGIGTIQPVADGIIEACQTPEPTLIAIHHQLQRHKVHYYWPPGIPTEESLAFIERLAATAPSVLLTSGHTHRNRVWKRGDLTMSEVASTRDWPGVWAGYTSYEGGITQTVRRASAPGAVRWHEYGRQALAGLWGMWSPGSLESRCFSHSWAN